MIYCLAFDCCCATTDHIIATRAAVLPNCTEPKAHPTVSYEDTSFRISCAGSPCNAKRWLLSFGLLIPLGISSGDVVVEYPGQQHYGKAFSRHRSCRAGLHSLFPADTLRTLWPHAARALSRPEPQACGASPLPGTAQGRLCLGTELMLILAALACHLTRPPGICKELHALPPARA